MNKQFLLVTLICLQWLNSNAQSEKQWLKHNVSILAGNSMAGRGYVNKGEEKASIYISNQFKEFGLKPFTKDSSYFQTFTFPVNTFPATVSLTLQKKELKTGVDYIIDAGSNSCNTEKIKVKKINLAKVKDSSDWAEIKAELGPGRAYILKNLDSAAKHAKFNIRRIGSQLPKGIYIIPQHCKLTWTVATDTIASAIYYVEDTVMPKRIRKLAAKIDSKFIPAFKSNNVLGFVPGTEKPDSFIVFTAHFDHLGKMGRSTIFPGAHDNASGTSVITYLAKYFAAHPQKYSIAFIAFSGEEAGLIGSNYFVEHPIFPLNSIRFVVNLDMTGDATNGITVVNAIEQKKAFELLNQINDQKHFLPKINERDQSHNSDHFHFSENGVSAIFIYGNGTKPYYHDVFDKAQELSFENIDKLTDLLIAFVQRFN